jgi:hypothetical protein
MPLGAFRTLGTLGSFDLVFATATTTGTVTT